MRGGKDQRADHRREAIDSAFADRLQAIASLNRLRLLRMLQEPRTIHEIGLEAADPSREGETMSQQGIRHHLNKLRKAEFVRERRVGRGSKRIHEYETDPRGLYPVAEFLRRLPSGEEDSPDELPSPIRWETETEGPRLTLVHGPSIGEVFRLQGTTSFPDRGWVVGSASQVDVPISEDPSVDRQAAEIERTSDGYRLVDLRAASTRAATNGEPLDRGGTRPLESGDVVGVGRCLLVFRDGR